MRRLHLPVRQRGSGDGSAGWDIAHLFTADRWRPEEVPAPELEIRLSQADAEELAGEVEQLAEQIVRTCCGRLGLPHVAPVVAPDAALPAGEYEVALSGAVRVAGSLETPWRSWWVDHPHAGPGGRTGVATGPVSADEDVDPAQKVARAVEEAVWDDPGLLLSSANATSLLLGLGPDAPVWGEAAEYGSILGALASRRVPLLDTDKLAEAIREVEAADRITRIEVLSYRCRPYDITVRLGEELHAALTPDNEEGRLQTELMPLLHEGLYAELGVGFPAITFQAAAGLPSRSYELVVNGLPRARGEIPKDKTLVNAEPQAFVEGTALAFVNPANGFRASWVDEAQAEGWASIMPTWNAAEFLILHLAACLREAAHEFTDLAWTQQLLQRLTYAADRADLAGAVGRYHKREFVTAVLCRLVEEGVAIRDLTFVLERMIELAVSAPAAARTNGRGDSATARPEDVVPVVEHVRREMKDRLSQWATQSWRWGDGSGLSPVVRETAILALDPSEEDAFERMAQPEGADSADSAHGSAVLRRLRRQLEPWDRPLPPVLVTSSAARPRLRGLIRAQFPRLKVLARDELTPDVRRERVDLA